MKQDNEIIVVRLHDGLGNQLFQYAGARQIAQTRGATLLLDGTSAFAHDRRYGALCQLQHFAIKATFAPRRYCDQPPFGRQIHDLRNSLSRHLPLRHRCIVREADFEAMCEGAAVRRLVWLEGYWQSPRYFSSITSEIARELAVVSPLSENSMAVHKEILATNAVCLHVRQMHGAHHNFNAPPPARIPQLPFSYYEEAVERLVARERQPTFFCFADNFEWIRERWKFPYPIRFVERDLPRERAYEDIALMSSCRHFVVGNSTFSWWGAWLSRSSDKYVVAPSNLGAVPWGSEPALFPKDWDILDIHDVTNSRVQSH